eukprot:1069779-Prorocentrum_minimum.AAC.2
MDSSPEGVGLLSGSGSWGVPRLMRGLPSELSGAMPAAMPTPRVFSLLRIVSASCRVCPNMLRTCIPAHHLPTTCMPR